MQGRLCGGSDVQYILSIKFCLLHLSPKHIPNPITSLHLHCLTSSASVYHLQLLHNWSSIDCKLQEDTNFCLFHLQRKHKQYLMSSGWSIHSLEQISGLSSCTVGPLQLNSQSDILKYAIVSSPTTPQLPHLILLLYTPAVLKQLLFQFLAHSPFSCIH